MLGPSNLQSPDFGGHGTTINAPDVLDLDLDMLLHFETLVVYWEIRGLASLTLINFEF